MPKKAFIILFALTGCASGTSHVEALTREFHPLDVTAVAATGFLLYTNDVIRPWNVDVSRVTGTTYRLTLKRTLFADGDDGSSELAFRQQAEKIASTQSCGSYRVLSYEERLENIAVGARRIVEGVIECIKG
ncbi:MAG TPA: hypothetical protein VMT94_06035 [Burkholderiales bacterium]|nr:hypothetical protein [Burkholderiales bacterium]